MSNARLKRIAMSLPCYLLFIPTGEIMASEAQLCIEQALLKASDSTPLASIRAHCEAHNNPSVGHTENEIQLEKCLRYRAETAAAELTVGDIKAECTAMTGKDKKMPEVFLDSRKIEDNPFVLLPLRQNYLLPYTYNSSPNQAPYEAAGSDLVDRSEAKLQISIKAPVTFGDLLTPNDGVYLGFTLKSFWQVYNEEASAPFRETNYRPEIYYIAPIPIASETGTWFGRIGLEHESNGRTQYLSRSWNRAYVTLSYATANWALAIQPWYRFPEESKTDDGDPATPPAPEGDDNPDIDDYLGNYEITGAYKWNQLEFTGLFRRNFAEGNGAHEIGVSFPLYGRLRGYVQYFEGYGESLIDYDHKNQRIGVGILLTDLM